MRRAARVPLPVVALLVLALLPSTPGGVALAHATLVLGEVTVWPDPPRPGEPFELTLTLMDPSTAPVEDAVVLVELRAHQQATAELPAAATVAPDLPDAEVVAQLVETAPARYRATLELPDARTYHLLVRDQTFEWEEANASLTLAVGGEPIGALPFILPPTAVGPRSLWTWLLWLVGLPVAAGIVVTILVLTTARGGRDAARAGAGAREGAGAQAGPGNGERPG